MRGLLAIAYTIAFVVFLRLARRAMRRSERHAARADWCQKRAADLETPAQNRNPGDQHE